MKERDKFEQLLEKCFDDDLGACTSQWRDDICTIKYGSQASILDKWADMGQNS